MVYYSRVEGAIYWYRLPEREVAPLKGVPVVAGGAAVGGAVVEVFVAGRVQILAVLENSGFNEY